MSNFGRRLKKLRVEKNLTLQELSDIFNKSKSTFSTYESGQYEPSLQMIEELADFFNVSADYLMGRTDKRKENWYDN